jgi:hypothetical protein
MKIIFNSRISDWYWQIYDELSRKHKLILPENYRDISNKTALIDLNALEKCVKENKDLDFIFDFRANFPEIVEWVEKRKIEVPMFKFAINAIDRPYIAKMSLFTKVCYVEKYAKPLMDKYKKENTIFLGMAANPYIYHPIKRDKIYDISFFGQHYGERAYWLKILKMFCNNRTYKIYFPFGDGVENPWSFADINELYNKTKINLSFAPKSRLGRIVNLRTFEICMSGNFQLMQYTPCIEDFFEIDKEIVCWKNKKELFKKVLYYLENEKEREKIAENGYKRAIENHTWSKRLDQIGTFLKSTKKFIDLSKFKIKIEQILDINRFNKIKEIQLSTSNQRNLLVLKSILMEFGYNIKNNLKTKEFIIIKLDPLNAPNYYKYKSNLDNTYFIEVYGKIMMVIKLISQNDEFSYEKWNQLEKILFLSENIDSSIPQFGILTTGVDFVIRDFVNKKWLSSIPDIKLLRSRANLVRYNLKKLIALFDKYGFSKLNTLIKLINNIKLIRKLGILR